MDTKGYAKLSIEVLDGDVKVLDVEGDTKACLSASNLLICRVIALAGKNRHVRQELLDVMKEALETVAPVAIENLAPRDSIEKALEGGGAL